MKYLIPENSERSLNSEKEYWEKIHGEDDYSNVVSLTDDPELRKFIINHIKKIGGSKIWIPGSGSRTSLQEELCTDDNIDRVVCSDFPEIIKIAKSRFNHQCLEYFPLDTCDAEFDEEFDIVLIVNSILSASDRKNRQQIDSCVRSLKKGGRFIGFFPTIYASYDICEMSNDSVRREHIDIKNSTKYEPAQDAYQIFYTPLRLRLILKDAGVILKNMQIYFLDSPYFETHGRTWREYVYSGDLVVYELYVDAVKQ